MRTAILIGIAALGCSAWSADLTPLDVKPGLWQASVQMPGMASMPAGMPSIPPEALARLPAAQRAQMEAMMKGRGGAPAATSKVCMSPDYLKQASPVGQIDKSCTYKVLVSSPAKQQFHSECKQDGSVISGDVTVERVDAEHITVTTVAKSSAAVPAATVKATLNWLSADCGDVKPAVAK